MPLDDRPVTAQLPVMLGAIAGRTVIEPPKALLGNYLTFGQPDAIIAWLNGVAAHRADAFVISTDMLAYGGLVASRVPSTPYVDAYFRLRELRQLRAAQPRAWIGAFGTVMRLAPTGVPANSGFFAAYPVWKYLQEYANLHDPPLPSEGTRAAHLRELIGPDALQGYLAARARDYAVDAELLRATADGAVNRVVLGQDDAGPVGLHVKEVRSLQGLAAQWNLGTRASIEPGADELGMALVAHALAVGIGWTPRVRVVYSTPDGAEYQDKLEFARIGTTIDDLVALCGGMRDDANPDLTLYVRVPSDTTAEDETLVAAMRAEIGARGSVAFADLSFLANDYAGQARFAQRLIDDGVMTGVDAYASWNTDANTVGTALAEAISAGVGRRAGTYDALAHREFTFNRLIDDYLFHDEVRPALNRRLDSEGIADHTYLDEAVAQPLAAYNKNLLWNRAQTLLTQLYPGYHIAAIEITLPWSRTFETQIEARIAPEP